MEYIDKKAKVNHPKTDFGDATGERSIIRNPTSKSICCNLNNSLV